MSNLKKHLFVIKRLIKNAKENDRRLFLLSLIFMICSTLYESMIIFYPKKILDLLGKGSKIDNSFFITLIFFLILGSISGFFSNYTREIAYARIGYLRLEYLASAFKKIITTEYKYMEDASFLNKYDSAFDACSNNESGVEKVYNVLFDMPMLILKITLFSCIIFNFSFIVAITSFAYVVIVYFLKRKSNILRYKYRVKLSQLSRKKRYFCNVTQDFMYGKDIRLFFLKKLLSKKYNTQINKNKSINEFIGRKKYFKNVLSAIIFALNQFVIYGILLLIDRNITIADITMYLITINIINVNLNSFVENINSLYVEDLFIYDYFRFVDAEINEEKKLVDHNTLQFKGKDIVIENLSFKYPNTDKYVLKNLNMTVRQGEKIAIIGQNGIGKTSLIKVLVGLFREFEGDIRIGGVSIRDIPSKNLFSMFGVVFQDINMLSFSIAENLTGSNKPYDEKLISQSLNKVGMKNEIDKLNEGVNSQIHKYFDENGVEFSGGEYQKLALARAIYKNSEFIVLDEPTANLDAIAEKEMYENFNEILDNKTTIFISHRLSSTRFCDKIYLIGEKGIVEEGTHDQLMRKKGEYYELFSLQGKYYQEIKYE